jgi:hypothetical protein
MSHHVSECRPPCLRMPSTISPVYTARRGGARSRKFREATLRSRADGVVVPSSRKFSGTLITTPALRAALLASWPGLGHCTTNAKADRKTFSRREKVGHQKMLDRMRDAFTGVSPSPVASRHPLPEGESTLDEISAFSVQSPRPGQEGRCSPQLRVGLRKSPSAKRTGPDHFTQCPLTSFPNRAGYPSGGLS